MTNVVWWFVGLVVSIQAMRLLFKFINKVFKRLGSDRNIDSMLDRAEDSMDNAADKVAGYFKERKRKKQEEERPIVTIR